MAYNFNEFPSEMDVILVERQYNKLDWMNYLMGCKLKAEWPKASLIFFDAIRTKAFLNHKYGRTCNKKKMAMQMAKELMYQQEQHSFYTWQVLSQHEADAVVQLLAYENQVLNQTLRPPPQTIPPQSLPSHRASPSVSGPACRNPAGVVFLERNKIW